MRSGAVVTAIAMAMVLCSGLVSAQLAVPRFEDFPVEAMYDGKLAPVILDTTRARQFRTVLITQAKERPNFAGQYRVAIWGCGSDCHAFAIIDARTGTAYFHPEALWVGGLPGNDDDRIQFRKNSRLFVLVGARNDKGEGTYYYEWTGKRLELIRTAPAVTAPPPDAAGPSTGAEGSSDFSKNVAHPGAVWREDFMGLFSSLFGGQKTDEVRRATLAAQGFSPCPERHAEIERRFNDLSTTTGQGGFTIRDPYCAQAAGHSMFFFIGVPPPRMSKRAGAARPAFMLPFGGVKGRAQVWLTNSAIEANPMLTKRIGLAMSALDCETPGSTLVTLAIAPAWKARNVIGAIGEPGTTLDMLLEKAALDLPDAGEHGFFRALFADGWVAFENFPYSNAFSAPYGLLDEQCAFAIKLAGR